MIKPWRAVLTLLLALCLPLQGVAASGGWWCALQGHDPLRMGAADAGHGAHHGDTPALTAVHAGHAMHVHRGQHTLAAAVADTAAQPTEPAETRDAPDGLALERNAPSAGPASGEQTPAGVTPGAGSCSVCAACCVVAWLPPAPWRTPVALEATPWAATQAGWPARLTLGNLDRPPRNPSA